MVGKYLCCLFMTVFLFTKSGYSQEIATDGAPPPEESQAISQDVANTVNPEATSPSELSQQGVLRIDKPDDETALIFKSGIFSDKVELVPDGFGCRVGDGLAARISFCSSDKASFSVRGGPTLNCPLHSGVFYGPCEVEREG
jgi:hypothetical protein